ncbi:major facilitator superfamily transporter [Fusarium circinatum]|uniref:Lysosomal dipeptide transporter MFSD1 n=1 Tax=Fusarium circinatum TaxID=48490 RepID=A0A8H5SS38_FUSCI|nr:major facilitator superfamily transporter [Fusarium circinatum]
MSDQSPKKHEASSALTQIAPDPTLENAKAEDAVSDSIFEDADDRPIIPMPWRLGSVLLICLISFGASWSARLTSSLKSTIKKELDINNTQFALLEASEEFLVTLLMMASGILTDRIGGTSAMLYGNLIMTAGALIIAGAATCRSFPLMIFGKATAALGDIATQIAYYRVFAGWFAPGGGFGTTIGLQIGIARIGGFVGSSTANVISKNTGNFAWVFWIGACVAFFTNLCTLVFFVFTKIAHKRFRPPPDPATGEPLVEKNKKFDLNKIIQLPWVFWTIMLFSMVQTSCSNIYSQNATELAEHRFGVDAVAAGWYASLSQYAGFFLSPLSGAVIDTYGHRVTQMATCGTGMLLSMGLINWSSTTSGAAASYAFYAIFKTFGPVTIIEGIRTSDDEQRNRFFIGNSIPNIVMDAMIIALPVFEVSKVQVPRSQKISIAGIFLLGGLIVIISCIRLKYIVALLQAGQEADFTKLISTPWIWTVLFGRFITKTTQDRSKEGIITTGGSGQKSADRQKGPVKDGPFRRLHDNDSAEEPVLWPETYHNQHNTTVEHSKGVAVDEIPLGTIAVKKDIHWEES